MGFGAIDLLGAATSGIPCSWSRLINTPWLALSMFLRSSLWRPLHVTIVAV
jgi:hypothetical protein